MTLTIDNLPLLDFFQLFAPTSVPATLSMTITWSGDLGPFVKDETSLGSRFVFDGVLNTVAVNWSARSRVSAVDETPFEFASSGSTTTVFAVVGNERNGVFAGS